MEKYSSEKKVKKLRKIKKSIKGKGLKIIDDTEDNWNSAFTKKKLNAYEESTNVSEDEEDEQPVFAGVVDERPLQVQELERFQAHGKWKKVEGDTSKTLDGKEAGLQNASALRTEMIQHRIREEKFYETLDDELSGRHAKTILRDKKTGTKRNLEEEAKIKAKEKKIADERKEQYDKWGKGLKQVEKRNEEIASTSYEMSKPLARYKDDEDLEKFLKEREREGDPMLKFLSKNKKESDKPRYNGPPPPPNRFKILPGARWDGVDRSNGYEKEWFSRINTRKAVVEEAYKWSVEDL